MDTGFTEKWGKKFRALTLGLIFSGALNIALVATLLFFAFQERENAFSVPPPAATQSKKEGTNLQWLQTLRELSFKELLSYLTNRDLVEEGFTKRDLALAALVTFHSFHIEKALSGSPLQRRPFPLNPETQVELFPGLDEQQFEAILRFAYEEKWPFTPKGLFFLLQKMATPRDPTLEQAFAVTPEFYALQLLFQKSGAPQETRPLLALISEGSWELIDQFCREQAQAVDLSPERRQRLLLNYLSQGSPSAASILLAADFSFALKKLDDKDTVTLLSLLKKPSPEGEHYCKELLRSPRSDAILCASAERLYAFAGETAPTPIDVATALVRFIGKASAPRETLPQPPERPSYALHEVKEGENLWKIARRYKIKLDALVQCNELQQDRLYPGMVLRIPQRQSQGTGSEPPR